MIGPGVSGDLNNSAELFTAEPARADLLSICSWPSVPLSQPSPQNRGNSDSAGNKVARDFGEPVFDLVEPGTISGGVMQREVWMVGKKGSEKLWAERLSTMRWISLPEGSRLRPLGESGQTAGWCGGCPVLAMTWPLLVSRAAGRAKGNTRTHGAQRVPEKAAAQIEPVECLAGRLLVHAEDSGMGLAGPDRVQ